MIKKSKNTNLYKAKIVKNDEFYTQISYIEKELKHYKEHFKDKVIYCNCDNPKSSNFAKYFIDNFAELGLKELIVNGLNPVKDNADNYFLHYYLKNNIIAGGYKIIKNREDGDFQSKFSVELLEKADIVVTNPPFSIFKEYVEQLLEYDKKFLIIGSLNHINIKSVFKLMKENKIRLGYGKGIMQFKIPFNNAKESNNSIKDSNGQKVESFRNIRWFTNLDIKNNYKKLILKNKYNPEDYPVYDNYDAINIDKVKDIPCDYKGTMGVPISFMDSYNPKDFEIIKSNKGDDGKNLILGERIPYSRILIRNTSI